MNNNSIVAIVILYNPDLVVLEKQYQSLYHQVNGIIFVDNTPLQRNKSAFLSWQRQKNDIHIEYLDMGGNLGIAKAQNAGIKVAQELDGEFVLLLDQDSVLPSNMVQRLIVSWDSLAMQGMSIATIGPAFIDEKTGEKSKAITYDWLKKNQIELSRNEIVQADAIIASGSIVNMDVFRTVGLLKEELFIDAVDTEWCLRAKNLGYDSFIDGQLTMQHSIGDNYVNFLGKKINIHSDFRNYFIVRNNIYLIIYQDLKKQWKVNQLAKTFIYVLFYSVSSKRKLYAFYLLNRAIVDGITKNMGKGYFNDKQGY